MIAHWNGVVFLIICGGIGIFFSILCCDSKIGTVIGVITSVLIAAVLSGLLLWHLYGTESGKRAQKTFHSNVSGGIEREIDVYDAIGNKIEHFEGKFDVEYYDERIVFDDQNGKRHSIYFKDGIVIVNEK